MSDNRTCFIISPIGEKDTDTRRHADNLIHRIIKPALSNFDFTIIRIDQSYSTSRITDEIITLIRNAELCIVDASEHNPNVMYELGRRHETGKPLILLRPIKQQIVFDIKDIKHVSYDLNEVDLVIEAQSGIQGFLEEFERQGFISPVSSVSIDSIASAINRIERRLDDLLRLNIPNHQQNMSGKILISATRTQEIIENLGLERGLMYCLSQRLIREAEDIFDLLEPKLYEPISLRYIGYIAGLGSRRFYNRIDSEIMYRIAALDFETLKSLIGGYVNAANNFDDESAAIEKLEPRLETDIMNRDDITDKNKAFMLNQLGRLYYGKDEKDKAKDYYARARELNKEELAYSYNYADTAKSLGDFETACRIVDGIMDRYTSDSTDVDWDHVALAYDVYVKNGESNKAASAMKMIEQGNPMLAQYMKTS